MNIKLIPGNLYVLTDDVTFYVNNFSTLKYIKKGSIILYLESKKDGFIKEFYDRQYFLFENKKIFRASAQEFLIDFSIIK